MISTDNYPQVGLQLNIILNYMAGITMPKTPTSDRRIIPIANDIVVCHLYIVTGNRRIIPIANDIVVCHLYIVIGNRYR
jgi:hypothetical protein